MESSPGYSFSSSTSVELTSRQQASSSATVPPVQPSTFNSPSFSSDSLSSSASTCLDAQTTTAAWMVPWQAEEDVPSCVNTRQLPHFVETKKDMLTVSYMGKGTHLDIGAVMANHPCPTSHRLFFFEVQILSAEAYPKISVGLVTKHSLLNKQPGIEPNTFAYRGEDGRKLIGPQTPYTSAAAATHQNGNVRGEPYGPAFGKGDYIGCAVDFVERVIFFTHNGKRLNDACSLDTYESLYPCAAMSAADQTVKFSFTGPFRFDLQQLLKVELLRERDRLMSISITPNVLHSLVRAYLVHGGYLDTLTAFDASDSEGTEMCASDSQPNEGGSGRGALKPTIDGKNNSKGEPAETAQQEQSNGVRETVREEKSGEKKQEVNGGILEKRSSQSETAVDFSHPLWKQLHCWPELLTSAETVATLEASIGVRKELLQCIRSGRILDALAILETKFASVTSQLDNPPIALALLWSQQVVEYLRDGDTANIMEAVEWIRTRLAVLQNVRPNVAGAIRDSCALVGYRRPETSEMSYMFHHSRRTLTADKLNQHVLKDELAVSEWSPLHVLLRQLTTCRLLLREQNGNRGPLLTPRQLCLPTLRQANRPDDLPASYSLM